MKKLSLYILLVSGLTLSGAVLSSCDNGRDSKPCKMQDCRPYRCRPSQKNCKKKCKPCRSKRTSKSQNY